MGEEITKERSFPVNQKMEAPPEVEKRAQVPQPTVGATRKIRQSDDAIDLAFSYEPSASPIFHITLPSKGLLYDGKLPEGRLELSPLTAREEKMLAGAKGNLDDVIETLFNRLVVTKSIGVDEFISTDRFYTLLKLRENSYGEDYSFEVMCEACSFKFNEQLKIPGDLDLRYLSEDAVEPFTTFLPVGQKTIGFHLLRGREEAMISRFTKKVLGRRKRVAKLDGDPAYSYRIALVIDSIDDVDVSDPKYVKRKIEFVERLVGKDSSSLQRAIIEQDCGVNTELESDCPSCGHTNKYYMPFTAEFFRPTS